AARELLDADRLAAPDALDQAGVGRRQEPDVLGVLAVDLLDRLRDDELHAGLQLAERRGLAARAAALRQSADDDREPAVPDRVAFDVSATQADEAVARERLVVVVAHPAGRDLVGRDVVDQLPLGVEVEVLVAVELALQEVRVLGQEQDAAGDPDVAALLAHPSLSTSIAIPCPPPMQADAQPRRFCVSRSSRVRVRRRRVPVAPSGWPSAIAPPLTLTLSRSRSSAFSTPRYCPANASLISNRSTSSTFTPARSHAAWIAVTGPMPMISGGTPVTAHETMRATGAIPSSCARCAVVTTSAAAPSTMPDALPAVTVPPSPN